MANASSGEVQVGCDVLLPMLAQVPDKIYQSELLPHG